MISNKVKRNLCLCFAVLSGAVAIERLIRFFDGSVEWWSLASAIVILACFVKLYLVYRKQVKKGNLYGSAKL